jgi:aminotransferase
MTGFRVGYAAGPAKVIAAMRELHLYTSICAPTISQMAAIAALTGPQNDIKKHLVEYKKRRDYICKRLSETGRFSFTCPEGAFYVFAKYDSDMRSIDFCHWLLKKADVTVVPGTDFGRYGEGHVRFSYATKFDLIKKAMDRLEKAVKTLR